MYANSLSLSLFAFTNTPYAFADEGTEADVATPRSFFEDIWCEVTGFFGFSCAAPDTVSEAQPEVLAASSTITFSTAMVSGVTSSAPALETSDESGTETQTLLAALSGVVGKLIGYVGSMRQSGENNFLTIQTNRIYDSMDRSTDGLSDDFNDELAALGDAFTTGTLAVTGDTTLSGAVTFASLPSGILTTDANGVLSTTTLDSLGAVLSVNGASGAVVINTDDIAEGANRYFTDARARSALSASVTGLDYATSTGILTLASGYVIPLTASTTEWTDKISSQWTTSGSDISYTLGNVGIGTTTPTSLLTLFKTSADPQQRWSYDASRFAELKVDAVGDLIFSASGGSAWLLDENFSLCEGGACPIPDSRISSAGNLLVENTVVANRFEEQCPTGYIWVPGSAKHGTLPGFCIMKYEAKNDGSNNAVSTATGNPWVSITQESARATCQAIGPSYHLISEAEWMTIAEQIANLPINDIDADAGLQLANGHTDNAPASALSAIDGADPVVTSCNLMHNLEHADNAYVASACELRGTGSGGSTANDKGYYGTGQQWSATGYSSGDANKAQLRTHVLSNGEVIWDITGNVWEWVDQIAIQNDVPMDATPAAEWLEYTAITTFGAYPGVRPPDDGWSGTNGIGRLYSQAPGTATRAFLRGGVWADTSHAGVFALRLTDSPTVSNSNIGFRCAR